MTHDAHPWICALADRLGSPHVRERVARLRYTDAGHGYDAFGLHPDWIRFGDGLTRGLYERWFRVQSHDAAHLPAEGGAILAANHSGTLPFDAAMIYGDVLRRTEPPRVVRPVLDHFVPNLPVVSTFFARVGAVGGSRGNVQRLLDQGELVLIFPEGAPGIGKPFAERYQLQRWRIGHAELAMRTGVPVVPVAVIGAEEQMPQLARLPLRAFGSPWLPIPATPLPLPVRYHLWYGEPLSFEGQDPDDPRAVRRAAEAVRDAVAGLISRGLVERRGVFR